MSVKLASLAAAFAFITAGGAMAQDAMSSGAMTPMMSDADLASCVEQAKAITFPQVAMIAEQACHAMHNGHDAMGTETMGTDAMGVDAMGNDTMSSGGAM